MKLLGDDNKHLNEKVVLLDHQVNQKRSPSSTSIEELNSVVNKQGGHDELSLNVLTYMMLGFGLHLKQRKLLKQLDEDIAPWERYSTGFPSKMLQKYGYNGGGLGKTGNGIVNPISIKKLHGSGVIVKESNTEEDGNTKLLNPPNRVKNVVKPWPPNTTLIIGDSILWGVEEGRLKKYNAKVRVNPGAQVDDLYDYMAPLLRRKPQNIILHIGSNDANYKPAEQIFTEIANLKRYIEDVIPGVKVILSCPVIRADNIKANHTLRRLEESIRSTFTFVCNNNVDVSCLGKKGLHLNPKGAGRLAMNYISLMRCL